MEEKETATAATEQVKRVKKKKKKEETLFDQRVNWLKNHPFFSWVLIAAFGGGTLVTIITMWGNAAPRIKNFVHDISPNKNAALAANPEAQELLDIVQDYFDDLTYGKFRAAKYFAPHIDKYFLVSNLTPDQVDSYFSANSLEFLSPKSEILDSTFSFSKDPSGDRTVDFWVKFNCFRKSKGKYEYCLSREEFIFDKNNKIRVLVDLQHKDLRYFNKDILLEGSVGKLPASFRLTFDYNSKKIAGSYYYPSRPGITYSMDGKINGTKIELTEYTAGVKTAKCSLQTFDNKSFDGTMSNTDGRQLKMVVRSSEQLFLGS